MQLALFYLVLGNILMQSYINQVIALNDAQKNKGSRDSMGSARILLTGGGAETEAALRVAFEGDGFSIKLDHTETPEVSQKL